MEDDGELIYYVQNMDDGELMYVKEMEDDEDPEGSDSISMGDEAFIFTGHKRGSSVFCGALSKDGKLAVTGDENDEAYLWDTTNGDMILACTGHNDSVTFAEFNHDESYLATGDMGGTIQVWKLADNRCFWDYAINDCKWMRWHMAANILLAGSADGDAYMWKIPDGPYKTFKGQGHSSETAAIFPDGKKIVMGYADGTLRVIELESSTVLTTISPKSGHSGIITALDCHPDNNLMLSADVGGRTILSTASTGKIVSVLQDFDAEGGSQVDNFVETGVFCRDATFPVAATGTIRGQIFIWDIPKQMLRQTIQQDGGISKLAWKGKTSVLFSAGLDGILRCYDARSGQCLRLFKGHSDHILDISISANGEKVLTTSDDSTARIFETAS